MFKIIGGAVVIIASFFLGNSFKRKLKEECEFTESLIHTFDVVKEEIRYNSDYLLESMQKAKHLSKGAESFFEKFCCEMNSGKSAETAWEEAALTINVAETRTFLSDAGKKIGKSDSEGQIKLFEMLVERLKVIHEKQTKAYEKQGSIYPKFGIASGVLITILLL